MLSPRHHSRQLEVEESYADAFLGQVFDAFLVVAKNILPADMLHTIQVIVSLALTLLLSLKCLICLPLCSGSWWGFHGGRY